jgi:hypothetical protein
VCTGERFVRPLIAERRISYVKLGKYVRQQRAALVVQGQLLLLRHLERTERPTCDNAEPRRSAKRVRQRAELWIPIASRTSAVAVLEVVPE